MRSVLLAVVVITVSLAEVTSRAPHHKHSGATRGVRETTEHEHRGTRHHHKEKKSNVQRSKESIIHHAIQSAIIESHLVGRIIKKLEDKAPHSLSKKKFSFPAFNHSRAPRFTGHPHKLSTHGQTAVHTEGFAVSSVIETQTGETEAPKIASTETIFPSV